MDGSNCDKYLSCLSQGNGFKCYMYQNLSNTLSIRYRFIAKKAIVTSARNLESLYSEASCVVLTNAWKHSRTKSF